jgi:hypothetical protein
VQLDISDCSGSGFYYARWKLVNAATGAQVDGSDAYCPGSYGKLLQNVSAGEYRLSITNPYNTGTYTVGLRRP